MLHGRSCLAGTKPADLPILAESLASLGFPDPLIAAQVNVTTLGLAAPDVLVLDLDAMDVDALELLRMTRFVLPLCVIAVHTGTLEQGWAAACHLAGATCILSKKSDVDHITSGLRRAMTTGCFTDATFAAP